MIQHKSPTILYLNKLSVLLVSLMLVFLWFTLPSSKPTKELGKLNHLEESSVNPFLRSHQESLSNDVLPTITTIQTSIPAFSTLQLKLHGIVYQKNQNSYAIISTKGAIQEIVRIKDEISEGLYLTHIAQKQVEVDYFGEKHILGIQKDRRVEFIGNPIHNQIKTDEKLNLNEQIAFLEVDKQRNPIRLFMIRRPYAVYNKGEFQGYKIMPGSNADQFKRLGFKSGDIITYLNGVEFTGPGMKEFVINQLTHAMNIDLIVLRNEQELSISYGF